MCSLVNMTDQGNTVIVIRPRSGDLPPIPDQSIIDSYFENPTTPAPKEANAGHYQHVLLNTRTGELSARGNPWHLVGPEHHGTADYYGPGELWPVMHWSHVPEILDWVIDSGVSALPYLTSEQLGGLLDELTPYAQDLLDGLQAIPGRTGELDWSAAAITAGFAIAGLVTRDRDPEAKRDAVPIDMDTAVSVAPALVQPRWAESTDQDLDHAADLVSRFATHWHPELESLGAAQRVDVVGARSWIYHYREQQAHGRRPIDASVWLQSHQEYGDVAVDDPPEALEAAAEVAQDIATTQGVKLLGALDFLQQQQHNARLRILERLNEDRDAVKRLGAELTEAKRRRSVRVARVLSWNDPDRYGTDAAIAERAGLSRTYMPRLRELYHLPKNPRSED